MRRFLIVAVAAGLLALVLPQLMAQNEQGADRVLQVVDSEPLPGQELGLDESITIYFDRPLDCGTIGSAFAITPTIGGDLRCNGTALTFTPDQSLEQANSYRLDLTTALRASDGAQLVEPYTLQLDTVGFLQVSETFPAADASNVQSDTALTIIFNRPVVPLTLLEERDTLVNPIEITPPTAGEGRWVNSSIYTFEPDDGWLAGYQYDVTVPAGLTTPDGAVLNEDFVLSFDGELPQVQSYRPTIEQSFPIRDGRIQMRFNVAMDRASVAANFSLIKDESGESLAGTFDWAEDDMGFSFTPAGDLEFGAFYTAVLLADARTANGDAPLAEQTQIPLQVVPYPSVTGTHPEDDSADVSVYRNRALIYFASAMDRESLEGLVTVSPEPLFPPTFSYRSWSNSYEIRFQPEAATEYTITMAAGAQDIYGNTIDEPHSFSYTTGDFSPEAQLTTPAGAAFYNAYREPTSVFITYRNMQSIDLALYAMDTQAFGEHMANTSSYDLSRNINTDQLEQLRAWTIDGSDVPMNALRYDLLEFTEANVVRDGIQCENALPSRLGTGDRAIVISDPDPVRARSAQVSGDVVELLYRDYALTVTGAPVCGDDGLVWLPVRLRDESVAWIAESIADEYLVAPRAATGTDVNVTDAQGEALDPGIYYLEARPFEFNDDSHLLVVSTVNLIFKNSQDSVVVWATNVQTGESLADLPITIYDGNYNAVASGVTDADGLMRLDVPEIDDLYEGRMAVVETEEHFGIGMSDWSSGIQPYNFGQSYTYFPNDYRIYLYADRPIYRPGQPVYFRGVVRSKDDVSYTVPENETITVTIRGNDGTIFEQNLDISPYGTFSGQLDLADDAALGTYYIRAEMPSRHRYRSETGGVRFSVAEYRLPQFMVDVIAEEDEVVQGDTIEVTVDSTYFFGGPVANANVEYNVVSSDARFNYEGSGRYDFIDYNADSGPSAFYASSDRGAIASGMSMTDDAGEFTLEVPASLEDAGQSQTYTIEATVRDQTNFSFSGRTTVTVHQGLVYVGLRPEQYVSRANEAATVNLITVDWDSEAVANQTIDVEVVQRRWSSVQEMDSSGRTTWTWEVEEIPVDDGTIMTNADGSADYTFVPPDGGTYKVYATTRDEQGNQVTSSTFMWVSSRSYVSWRQQNSNRIELISDQENYDVGDTAQILITSPFQGETEALVTVERGDVLMTDRITMDSNSYLYELPIREAYSPNVFVSVAIVKGVDETNPVAAFRMGYLEFGVETTRRMITIDVETDVDRTSPQQTVTYDIRTTDWQGNPVAAEVGIGVTDLAALSLGSDPSRPILDYFYYDQSLGIRTSTPLTVNADQLTQETLDTVKGGGGGFLQQGIVEIRGDFIDTTYWNPSVVTDADGRASFDVSFPDNLTTWRLNARAVTLAPDGNMLVGQDTFDLLSTKPLIIRPVTPRFFIRNDEVVLAAVVNNNTERELETVVTINHDAGITLNSDPSQVVTIPAAGQVRVTWDVTINDAEQTQLSFVADAGELSDGSISAVSIDEEGTLPIYRYVVPETVGTSGVLFDTDSRIETIPLSERFDIERGELTVQVDQSLAAVTIDSLDYLRNYRYQCTEHTVSRFLPNLMTLRALAQNELSEPLLASNTDSQVRYGLQTLIAEQNNDGGWAWCQEGASNIMTTAYALIGLTEARLQGYTVPANAVVRAQTYLRENFEAPSRNQSFYRANRQVVALYALARSGTPDAGRTATMYEYRDNLSLYAKAMLADTFYMIDRTSTTRTDTLLDDISSDAYLSAAGVHWEEERRDVWNWNTNTRTTAQILIAYTKLRPNSDLLPGIVRYLIDQREADRWESSYETAWVVMALTDYMETSGELDPDYDYTVTWNDDTRIAGTATRASVFDSQMTTIDISEFETEIANELTLTRTGSDAGALYYTAYLDVDLPVPQVQAVDNGIIVERRYSMENDPDATPITTAAAGDLVEVRLTFIVPTDMHNVLIDSPHPAGAEAVDPNLRSNRQIGTRPSLDNDSPLRYGWGWWYFSNTEFRDDRVVIAADYLPAGTYEYVYALRPTIPGTYNVIPATAQQLYFPDVYGRTAGMSFTVLPDAD
jgi:alpha-2-macroglobulin